MNRKIIKEISLEYPRVDGHVNTINIELIDVRAANNIEISYDFDRDGWSIVSDMYDVDNRREMTPAEVAFIPAWPNDRVCPGCGQPLSHDEMERDGKTYRAHPSCVD